MSPAARDWPTRRSFLSMVGAAGFEPAASCSQSRRANQAALRPARTKHSPGRCLIHAAIIRHLLKTSLTRDSASKVRVQIEATSEEVEPSVERAVRSLSNQVKVPGFRKGHVPRKVLETRLGSDALREAVLREAIPELLAKATEEETLAPVAPPSVEVTSYDLDSTLSFEATIEVRPEI